MARFLFVRILESRKPARVHAHATLEEHTSTKPMTPLKYSGTTLTLEPTRVHARA